MDAQLQFEVRWGAIKQQKASFKTGLLYSGFTVYCRIVSSFIDAEPETIKVVPKR